MSISYKKITEMIEVEAAELALDQELTKDQLAQLASKIFMIESSVDGRSTQSKREAITAEVVRLAAEVGIS
jgi:hypothetical protein